ncbi:MAG: hypothetical protein ACOC7U_01935 [Spirochaetota bacterium]
MADYGKPKADFTEEKERLLGLLEREENQDIVMRLIGALAFNTRCTKFNYIQAQMGREFTDIDFASYRKFTRKIEEFMKSCGYQEDRQVSQLYGESRLLFHDTEHKRHVDVFLDQLRFSHTIHLKGRLEKDKATIPLAELFLEKMQIAKINEKDLIDTIMLLREYDFGNTDQGCINKNIILGILSKDWGFWKTVTDNLNTLKKYLERYTQLKSEDKEIVKGRIDKILVAIEKEPKAMKWKLRSRIGTKVKWYQDVDELGV